LHWGWAGGELQEGFGVTLGLKPEGKKGTGELGTLLLTMLSAEILLYSYISNIMSL
jgi:hypothetical protein